MTFSFTPIAGMTLLAFTFLILNFESPPVQSATIAKNEPLVCDCIIELGSDVSLNLGDEFEISPLSNCAWGQVESFSWSAGTTALDPNSFEVSVAPVMDQCYTLTVNWIDACTTIEEICVSVNSCDSDFATDGINSVTPEQIGDEATIELEIARTQFVHIDIMDGDDVAYEIWEGFLKAGLRTVTLDFTAVPAGNHELRVRLYPESQFINIQKL